VTFTEGVSAREDDNLRGWLIQFTLTEKLSNPEKVEGRRSGNAVTAQSGPGGQWAAAVGEPIPAADPRN